MKFKLMHYHLELTSRHLVVYQEKANTLDEALLYNQEVLLQNPDDHAARYALGNVLRMQGRIRQAREEYVVVAQADSPYAEAAARMLVDLDGKDDLPRMADRTLQYRLSTRLWNPALLWKRWKHLVKKARNNTSY